MNDMQKDLLAAIEVSLIKVHIGSKIRRQASGEPGVVLLYVEPSMKPAKPWDCVTALEVTFMAKGFGLKRMSEDLAFSAEYHDGVAIRAVLEQVRMIAAADAALRQAAA